jgi:cellulose synthase/poly-beta-1,6-N-acetylglucosamine synthase-like glycosyltransferase
VEKLEIVIVSDGSTDRTNEILRNVADPRVRAIFLPARRGKWNALNRGVSVARHEILMFADASTVLDSEAVTKLVRHFDDPRVGAVCGALEFRRTRESAQTEGVYWRYESALRLMEGRLGATLTASGALYAVRKECYVPLAADAVIDDFVIPMLTRQAGFRVVYDPEAVATEVAAAGISGEFRRRVRLAVGSFRAIGQFARVRLDPITLWAFVSHKVLRWIVPFLLLGLLVSSVLLWQRPLYMWVLVTQGMFYLWAMAGLVFPDRLRNVRFGLIAYYVLAIHVAFLVGFIRYISGRQESTWQRVS